MRRRENGAELVPDDIVGERLYQLLARHTGQQLGRVRQLLPGPRQLGHPPLGDTAGGGELDRAGIQHRFDVMLTRLGEQLRLPTLQARVEHDPREILAALRQQGEHDPVIVAPGAQIQRQGPSNRPQEPRALSHRMNCCVDIYLHVTMNKDIDTIALPLKTWGTRNRVSARAFGPELGGMGPPRARAAARR